MNIFGLDIGSNTIKICQTVKTNGKFNLVSAGLTPTPGSGLRSEAESDLITLATTIKKLHSDLKISTNKTVISLPENLIFSKIIDIPKMKEEDLETAIPWEAEQSIPLPINEVSLDWQIVGESKSENGQETIKVLIIAAPKNLIDKYLKVCKLANLEIVAIETELLSLSRIFISSETEPIMITEIGATATDIGIISNNRLVFSRSIPTAGDALTRAISSGLSMEIAQAEQYKIAYGLDESQLEGKIARTIKSVYDVVIGEVNKSLIFWKENNPIPVKRLILCGGTANLPQGTSSLANILGIEVQVGDPFAKITITQQQRAFLQDKASLLAISLGLSIKEI